MYCQKCHYPLQELTGSACPECGRAFDANSRATWDAAPARPKVSAVVLLVGTAAVIAMLFGLDGAKGGFGGSFWSRGWWVFILVPVVALLAGWWANWKRLTFAFGVISATAVLLAHVMNGSLISRLAFRGSAAWNVLGVVVGFIGTIVLSRVAGSLGFRLRVVWRSAAAVRRLATWRTKWYRPRTIALSITGSSLVVAGWLFVAVHGVVNGEPTRAVDYDRMVTEQRAALTGQEPEAARARWIALEEATGRFNALLTELDAAYRLEGHPPRGGFGMAGLEFMLVTEGDDLSAMLDPERDAIERLRADSAWAEIQQLVLGPMPMHEVDLASRSRPGSRRPDLSRLREFSRVSRASMRFDATDGAIDRFAESFEAQMAIGQMLSYQGPIIELLTSHAISENALNELQLLLMEREFDDATCRRFVAILDERQPAPEAVVVAFEQAVFLSFMQSVFSDDGEGDGYWLPAMTNPKISTWDLWRSSWQARFAWVSRRVVTNQIQAGIASIEMELQRPLHERWEESKDDVLWGSDMKEDDVSPAEWAARMFRVVLKMTLDRPAWQQQLELTRLLLAIERYIAAHGRPPQQLDDLLPEFLDEVLIDPETGQSFGYTLREDGTCLIYTYGHDKTDNGGTYNERYFNEGRYPGGEGLDVPLTVPRAKRE